MTIVHINLLLFLTYPSTFILDIPKYKNVNSLNRWDGMGMELIKGEGKLREYQGG